MTDLAEKEYIIPIRKNSNPEQSNSLVKKEKINKLSLSIVRAKPSKVLPKFLEGVKATVPVTAVINKVNEVRSAIPRLGVRKLYHILQHGPCLENVGKDKLFSILKANQMLIKPKRWIKRFDLALRKIWCRLS